MAENDGKTLTIVMATHINHRHGVTQKPFEKIDAFLKKHKSSPISLVFSPRLVNDMDEDQPIKAAELSKIVKIYNKLKAFNTPDFYAMNGKMLSDFTVLSEFTIKKIKVVMDFSMIDDSFAIEHILSPDDDGNYPINDDNLIGFPSSITLSVASHNENMGKKAVPKPIPRPIPKAASKKKVVSPKTKEKGDVKEKIKDKDKILNPKTGRMVLKTGKIGQQILAGKM